MKNFIKYIIAAAFTITVSIVFYINSFKLPEAAYRFPRIIMAVVVLLSLGMVAEAYLKCKNEKDESTSAEESGSKTDYKKAFIFALMIGIYVFTIKSIGYFVMTPLFVIASYVFLKSTNMKNILLLSIGFTAFVYFVFVTFLKLPIPMGILS